RRAQSLHRRFLAASHAGGELPARHRPPHHRRSTGQRTAADPRGRPAHRRPARPQRHHRTAGPVARTQYRGRRDHREQTQSRRSLSHPHRPPGRYRYRTDGGMTTTLIEPTTAPARPAPPPAGRVGLRRTVDNTLTMAYRGLLKIKHNPEQLFDVVIQPVIFTLMFTYIFGGAISGDVQSYLPVIIPGILVQTVVMTS